MWTQSTDTQLHFNIYYKVAMEQHKNSNILLSFLGFTQVSLSFLSFLISQEEMTALINVLKSLNKMCA